jgi:imidazolonepropionase-like amidohydrolase
MEEFMQRIDAELLIPGSGEPVAGGTVILDGQQISYAGLTAGAPDTPDITAHQATAVMPGMWDCHGHLLGIRKFDLNQIPLDPDALRAARCARDLTNALNAGITSIREVGGLGIYLARAVAEGLLDGPSIYASGGVLSMTGGHGDLHSYPLTWMQDYSTQGSGVRLTDGVADCLRAVREQLRRNAKVIKICASGGIMTEVDHPIHQQFTSPELKAIVEVAGMADRVVAAHCHGKPGIMAALEAGVRTIEHGTYLDDEVCDVMLETGAILVPTRSVIESIVADMDSAPAYAQAKVTVIAEVHASAVALAIERGVTVAMGTDISMTGMDMPDSWGTNGSELVHLVKLGMTPLQAIEAATAKAPLTLGPQAPRSGRLEAGYDADVITLDADPLLDISVLTRPEQITGVWTAGRKVK